MTLAAINHAKIVKKCLLISLQTQVQLILTRRVNEYATAKYANRRAAAPAAQLTLSSELQNALSRKKPLEAIRSLAYLEHF